jgi:hypothetical protein
VLTVYWDSEELQIKELSDDPEASPVTIRNKRNAIRILRLAKKARPDVAWRIDGMGPYRVVG